MGKIVLMVDDSISYENLNRNRIELTRFLKQKGLPITMSYCEDVRQNDIDVSQIDPSSATPADVSGGPILGATSGISA
jgi:hypothetical protein